MIKEFKQHYNINYNEIYVFIVKLTTYKVIFAIAVYYNYYLKQMNIKMIFFNEILKEKVFITQSTEYINETEIYQFNKTLYKLKQLS